MWYHGICDELLQKIALWNQTYWSCGEVHSTRKWLDPKSGQVQDKPTKVAHTIPFREVELEHLCRIVNSSRPGSQLSKELDGIRSIWRNGKPVVGNRYNKSFWSVVQLPTGIHRLITVCFYQEHVKEILEILSKARDGQKAETIDMQLQTAKESGKDLFEE